MANFLLCYLLPSVLIVVSWLPGLNGGMSPIVTTKTGRVRGQSVQVTLVPKQPPVEVYQFMGIPFAIAPIGQLRFKKPVPVTPWQGVYNATRWPNGCIQNPPSYPAAGTNQDYFGSEDCLYLNLWVPKSTLDVIASNHPDQRYLSVFVFIHGGNFQTGSTKDPLINGRYLSAYNGIIVATIQYRLGSLGFAYLRGTEDVPGNMGLWDQLEALKWISDNIAAFGGNNQQVTLGGQDAGAISTSYHLLSAYSRRYFQRAIIQSGTALSPWGRNSPEVAKAATNNVFQQVCGYQDLSQCLRFADPKNFPRADRNAQDNVYEHVFQPIAGAGFINGNPKTMLLNNDFSQVPMLIGANKDEGSMSVATSQLGSELLPSFANPDNTIEGLDKDDYDSLMHDRLKQYGGEDRHPVTPNRLLIDAVKLQYWPRTHEGNPQGVEVFSSTSDAVGDHGILCPSFTWANITSHTVPKVFAYYFTQRRVQERSPEFMGVTHGSELPFIFGQPLTPQASAAYSDQERQLSRMMMLYWGNFIRNGDPNSSGLRSWPSYSNRNCSQQYFELNLTPRLSPTNNGVICGLKERDCWFWSDYLPRLAEKQFLMDDLAMFVPTNNSFVISRGVPFPFFQSSIDNFSSTTTPSFNNFVYSARPSPFPSSLLKPEPIVTSRPTTRRVTRR